MQKQSKGHTFVLVSLLRQWWEQGYSIYLRMILNSYSIVIRKKTSNNRISIEKESNINRISEVESTNLQRCNYLSKTTWDKNENPDLYKHYKGPYSLFKKKQSRLSSQTRKNPIFAPWKVSPNVDTFRYEINLSKMSIIRHFAFFLLAISLPYPCHILGCGDGKFWMLNSELTIALFCIFAHHFSVWQWRNYWPYVSCCVWRF